MDSLKEYITNPIVKSFTRTFLAVVLTAFIAGGADLFAVSLGDLRAWLAAGIAASGAVLLRALDGSDPAFGRVNVVDDPAEGVADEDLA